MNARSLPLNGIMNRIMNGLTARGVGMGMLMLANPQDPMASAAMAPAAPSESSVAAPGLWPVYELAACRT